MRDFSITLIADGFLLGITYYPKGEVEEDDWTELNLWLGIARLTWSWH